MTEIEGIGSIMVQGSFGSMPTLLLIRNVLYAPGLTNNLFSGVMLTEADLKGKLHESGLDLSDQTSGELRLGTSFLRGMPRVVLRPVCPAAQAPLNYGNPHSQCHCLISQLDANIAWEPRHCTGTGGEVMDPTNLLWTVGCKCNCGGASLQSGLCCHCFLSSDRCSIKAVLFYVV